MSKLSIVIGILATVCIFTAIVILFIYNIFTGGFGPGTVDYHYKLSDKYEVMHCAGSEYTRRTIIGNIETGKDIIGNELNGIACDENFIITKKRPIY